MKKVLLASAVVGAVLLTGCTGGGGSEMDRFLDGMMSRMTLEEKIGQLNLIQGNNTEQTGPFVKSNAYERIKAGQCGAILNNRAFEDIYAMQKCAVEESRLGIPLIFGLDVVHGFKTVFPIPLAQAATWDVEAIEQAARFAAIETSAGGVNWTYAPMVDIATDGRWGRMAEGAGEDPYLGSQMAVAQVKGFQGDLSRNDQILACMKHFALYGASESGRDYNTVDMSRVKMYNQYLPPYKAAVEAGVGSVMSSFNVVDGIPATANKWLLDDLLRGEWGFDGFVVTDYASIAEMPLHGIADEKESAIRAFDAGTDMDMVSELYIKYLAEAVKEGRVSEKTIDISCRRILEAKYKLGLFQDPYRFLDKERAEKEIYTPEAIAAARNMAAESFVLLKNKGNILPLAKKGTVALVGPLIDDPVQMCGTWAMAAMPNPSTSLRDAMTAYLAGTGVRLLAEQGCDYAYDEQFQADAGAWKPLKRLDNPKSSHAKALAIARQADVVVAAMGELAENSGECASRVNLELPDAQMDLLKELVALGKPVILLNFAGRSTVLKWESENVMAILNVWFGGSEAANAICDVLFGDKEPGGRLPVSLPQHVGQLPLYYNHLNTGRPIEDNAPAFSKYVSNYIDVRNDALYPFGAGMGYTRFEYSPVTLSAAEMAADGSVKASVTLTNTGNRAGDEVVQLYIHDIYATVARPVKELKGFRRVHLQSGESRTVEFTIDDETLKFYNADLQYVMEPGEFEIMIGHDSQNLGKALLNVK